MTSRKRKLEDESDTELGSLGFLLNGPAKKAKVKAAPDTGGFKFKRDIERINKPQRLKLYAKSICAASALGAAYYIPKTLITSMNVNQLFEDVFTAKPKPKQYRGKNTNPPWAIFDEMMLGNQIFYRIPRRIGIQLFGVPPKISVKPGDDVDFDPQIELYDGTKDYTMNQQLAVGTTLTKLKQQIATEYCAGAVFVLPTGQGKTACASHMFARLGGKGLFVTPSMDFYDQVKDDFEKFLGPDVRVGSFHTSMRSKWDIDDKDIMVTTWDSISGIDFPDELMNQFRTVVVDEVHGTVSAARSKMYLKFRGPYVVALSATPERTDQAGAYLEWLVGPLTWYEESDLTLTRWGKVIVNIHRLTFTSVPLQEHYMKHSGELDTEKTMQTLLWHKGRHQHVVDTIQRELQQGRRCLILGKRVTNMQNVHRDLVRRGVDAGLCVDKTSDGKKVSKVQRAEAKTKPALICTQSIGYQALNIVELDTLILLDPPDTNDKFWRQVTGRIIRNDEDKHIPKIVMFRDVLTHTQRQDNCYYSQLVDSSVRTMRRYSPEGYEITETEFKV